MNGAASHPQDRLPAAPPADTGLEEHRLEVDGLHLQYWTAGQAGPPVVLLHGGGVDNALLSWRLLIPVLAQNHQVFAPNWPGYGDSRPVIRPYTAAALVPVLERLMDAWGLERAALAGVSMGGGAALAYALENPERVERLVPVDSYGLACRAPFHRTAFLFLQLPFLIDWTWAILRRSRRLSGLSLQGIFADPQAATPQLVDEVYAAIRQPNSGRAFYAFQRDEVRWGGLTSCFVDRLPSLRVPTLFIHGERDNLVPLQDAQNAAALVPGARLLILEDCGHWPQREKPEIFTQHITAFLTESRTAEA